ncbi:MAG: hypothetical protein ACRYFV_22240 [Janthinobacterium lividum]
MEGKQGDEPLKFIMDFANHRKIDKDGELSLIHNPIDYEYKGSVQAGTGSKNRHRHEKTITTWRRKFASAQEAENFLIDIDFESHFEQDVYLYIPYNDGFKALRKVRLGPGWKNLELVGGSLSTEVDYYIEDNT